jgi:hypothetical protein
LRAALIDTLANFAPAREAGDAFVMPIGVTTIEGAMGAADAVGAQQS